MFWLTIYAMLWAIIWVFTGGGHTRSGKYKSGALGGISILAGIVTLGFMLSM